MNLQDNLDIIPEPPFLEVGRYRHYKGNEYIVLGVALHTETLESFVMYQALDQTKRAEFWVRPYDMFVGQVAIDGTVIPRFKKLD